MTTIRKALFYLAFVALGVYWAEAFNIPGQLLHPFLYPIYGLSSVLFLDSLMRWRESRFKVWYLYGALIGFCVETYVAKVVFHGLEFPTPKVFGVAPFPIAFIVLFFHPFVSFLIPAYLFRRLVGAPVPIPTRRWLDILCVAAPLLRVATTLTVMANRGQNPIELFGPLCISSLVLSLWFLLLRLVGRGKTIDVLLSRRERLGLAFVAIAFYAVALFTLTNKQHGHAPTDFPIPALVFITAMIIGLIVLLRWSSQSRGQQRAATSFDSGAIPIKLVFGWLLSYVALNGLVLFSHQILEPFRPAAIGVFGLLGAGTGATLFVWSITSLVLEATSRWRRQRRRRRALTSRSGSAQSDSH